MEAKRQQELPVKEQECPEVPWAAKMVQLIFEAERKGGNSAEAEIVGSLLFAMTTLLEPNAPPPESLEYPEEGTVRVSWKTKDGSISITCGQDSNARVELENGENAEQVEYKFPLAELRLKVNLSLLKLKTETEQEHHRNQEAV